MVLSLLALALAPGLAIAFFIYSRDKYDREPLRNLAMSFMLGVVSIIPAVIFQTRLQPVLDAYFSPDAVTYYLLFAFVLVAISEEGSKFLMLRFYAYRQPAFNEPFDGIIYSVMVSMGFATFENIWYVLENGYATGFLRMFLSVPAHAAFGVLMGFHAGLAKFDHQRPALRLLMGLLLAIVFHGGFDFFLFLQNSITVTSYISTGMLAFGAIVCYWIAMRLAWRAIRIHQNLSKEVFENP